MIVDTVSGTGQRIGSSLSTPLQRGALPLRAGGGRARRRYPAEAHKLVRTCWQPHSIRFFRSINCGTSYVQSVMRTGGFPWITCTPSGMLQQH